MVDKKSNDTSLMKFIGDPSIFINKNIYNLVKIELNGFEFFFDLVKLDKTTREELSFILNTTRKLPAALGEFHGNYDGGLFDHILLVVNYTYYLVNSLRNASLLKRLILTAICHDFGKIPYYIYKLGLKDIRIKIEFQEMKVVRSELHTKYDITGEDGHVENAIAVIRKYIGSHASLFDDDMYLAIVFHHGGWSRYRPIQINEFTALLHNADMFSSHVLKI